MTRSASLECERIEWFNLTAVCILISFPSALFSNKNTVIVIINDSTVYSRSSALRSTPSNQNDGVDPLFFGNSIEWSSQSIQMIQSILLPVEQWTPKLEYLMAFSIYDCYILGTSFRKHQLRNSFLFLGVTFAILFRDYLLIAVKNSWWKFVDMFCCCGEKNSTIFSKAVLY